jgi:hypothetical protein
MIVRIPASVVRPKIAIESWWSRGRIDDETLDTFEELAALYIKNYAMQNRRSWQDDEMLLRVHVTEAIGKRRLVTLDGPTMARLHHGIVAKKRRHDAALAVKNGRPPRAHAGGRIADRVLDLIKAILRWGIPLGYVMGDFTIGIRKAAPRAVANAPLKITRSRRSSVHYLRSSPTSASRFPCASR